MPLIGKYYRLLVNGIWDMDDRDVTHFLRMLGTSDMEETAAKLKRAFDKAYEPDDVFHELVVVLYTTAKRFTNIASNFKFVAKDRVTTLVSDPIVYQAITEIDPAIRLAKLVDRGVIDTSWVNGLTAGPGFDRLSTLQRAILKYIYNDRFAQPVAAKKLKISVMTLKRRKKEAEQILADHFKLETSKGQPHLEPGQDIRLFPDLKPDEAV